MDGNDGWRIVITATNYRSLGYCRLGMARRLDPLV